MGDNAPGNGNQQDHRDLRKNVAELWTAFREHVVEAKGDSVLLAEHLKKKHLSDADVEAVVVKKMEEAKQAGRSDVSLQREKNQLWLARAGITGTIVTILLGVLSKLGIL